MYRSLKLKENLNFDMTIKFLDLLDHLERSKCDQSTRNLYFSLKIEVSFYASKAKRALILNKLIIQYDPHIIYIRLISTYRFFVI